MHPTVLLLAAAASAVMANQALVPGHLAVKRAVEARQTDDSDDFGDISPTQAKACLSTITEVLKDVPTPPAAIVSFAVTQTETDPCKVTIPNSLTSAYSSYGSALEKWYSTKSDSLNSALKVCPGFESFTENLDVPTCSTDGPSGGNPAATKSGVPAQTTPAGNQASQTPAAGNGNGNGQQQQGGSNNNPAEGAAASHKGLTGAAVLMAGLLGAVALL